MFTLESKGQLIAKANCQAREFFQKRTNEFVFTTMQRVFVHFLEEIEATKKAFRNCIFLRRIPPKNVLFHLSESVSFLQ